ncbi:MAG: toll/interleukin-1 receptor domain-containing protein [Planctomycetaceae bacterium]|jgi:hypothetical protein|nr:toll/interleukin-1 receptor domain-containing protein [Planctomycetaceae bacterium]
MQDNSNKYFAFISYSHKDIEWAKWLSGKLEKYTVPRNVLPETLKNELLVSKKRLFPVFRDQDELPTSADLSNAIVEALRTSNCLLVICSPNATQSQWVNEEIRQYKAMGRTSRILAVLVSGEPNTDGEKECFPPALRYEVTADGKITDQRVEPLAADLRAATAPKDKKAHDTLDKEFLRIAAGVWGVGFDTLFQREYRRRMRQLKQRVFITAVSIIALLRNL